MKIHRFIGNFKLKIGVLKLEDGELFNQFRNVLKLKAGEKVIIGDGKGNEGISEIKEYGKDSVTIEVAEISVNQNETDRHVILYCAVLKKENFELVVQKATEVGIKEIVPIITARTVKLDIRKDRLEKIIKEASEQSGRGIVPILHDPSDFDKAVEGIDKNSTNLFFDASGMNLSDLGPNTYNLLKPISVWVGPEGGWTPEEVESAKNSDFRVITLGKTTLRAETAAIVGTYLIVHNL